MVIGDEHTSQAGNAPANIDRDARRNVLFVLDPLEIMNPVGDSSYVMITEALRRGYQPYIGLLSDLVLDGPSASVHARALGLEDRSEGPPRCIATEPRSRRDASDFCAVVMRKDPPVDDAFMVATWWLDRAASTCVIVNNPQGLRDLNEKLAILEFSHWTPRTLLLRKPADLRRALAELGGQMILKPVYGHGGRGVLIAREGDPNLNTLFELATDEGRVWTIAQAFVPEASLGDKRILLVEGTPVGAVLRVPAKGELRNNFHVGGRPAATELTAREREICAEVGPYLASRGQMFVGLDVLGDYLSEINVTSPTGMQEVNRLAGLSGAETMQAKFWDALEAKIQVKQGRTS